MASISDLSWNETSFRAKVRLFSNSKKQEEGKMQSGNPMVRASGCSALSSTYYSIVGTAFSHLKIALKLQWSAPFRLMLWCCTWLPLAVWCYWWMLVLSNHVVMAIGYERMSVGQCDIRQSILRRRNYFAEAKRCILKALLKDPEAHTLGLLRVGLAEVYRKENDKRRARIEIQKAVYITKETEKTDPKQAARIYRGCASIMDFLENGDPTVGDQFRCRARSLLQSARAEDQLLKLQ